MKKKSALHANHFADAAKYSVMHERDTFGKFNTQSLNHTTMLFDGGRRRESLNGQWFFTLDQYSSGVFFGWPQTRVDDPAKARASWDYEYNAGTTITVPSCWNMVKKEYHWFEGSAWYSRRLSYQARQRGERLFLRIGAASYDARVFLNGEFIGNHYGASTPFFVELTKVIKKENVLQICVNNTRLAERVPALMTDWFNYGGIYREVELIRTPAAYIKSFEAYLLPASRSNSAIECRYEVSDILGGESLEIAAPQLGINAKINLRAKRGRIRLKAHPELWSPQSPVLYRFDVRYGSDRVADRIGFRRIEVKGTSILLNGEKIFLRGISVHEDDQKHGKCTSEADIRRRFAHAKELGCNFLRLAHYPHHELAAKIADEVGLLLWEEVPVYWGIQFDNPFTYADAQNQLLELIKRDMNRASVVIWSVGNENPDDDDRFRFMTDLAACAKKYDPTRLVSAACLVRDNRIKDRLAQSLDIIGQNEYYGWYELDFSKLRECLGKSRITKPVIISETGGAAIAGFHGPARQIYTEEYLEELYKKQVAVLREFRFVAGISPWILYDFRCPRRWNRWETGFNKKGLIDADKKTKKKAFAVLQRFYRTAGQGHAPAQRSGRAR